MFKQLKVLAVAAVMALAAGSLTACSGDDGAVKIGIKFDQPGLGQQVGNSYEGFDIDVANFVAKELGYESVEFVETPSAQRETMLQSDQVKMIFATYSITDERKEKVSFAGPYIIAGQDLLVRADATDINGPEDLPGKRLCSVKGSTSAQNLNDKYGGQAQLQEYDNYSKCVEALAAGNIDVVSTDNTILYGFASQDQYKGKIKVVGETFSEERYGVGIKKGDTELCNKINDALTKMVESGEWQAAADKYLGPAGFELGADNPPTPDACS
ncbi:MAG TPA: glutamate ABC transporter substrate-binding protein [Candidatus Avipropionibacterium avicola]|uniref:Glutamate ABC transporter substrate-binding protein n=1 Tax=Candidatus Avipropionibacterium avicola TaxID=2840701 RepID=A0A9D1GWQ0_9ACTN|nr:glutamate ABC transporter substrate-binding protein [Candidatus Avipropionibacterium avicola]